LLHVCPSFCLRTHFTPTQPTQLYTSGSTGKPKGVVHTTAGYMLGAYATFKYVFDYKPTDVFWCTADCGWITGHTYIAYGVCVCV
jgi:acetyl-CoA synthetase